MRPIEPLLDAIGVVFDLVVTPIVGFLNETIGLDEILNALAAELDPLVHDPDLLERSLNVATGLEQMLDQIDIDTFDVPDFADITRWQLGPKGQRSLTGLAQTEIIP